MLSIYWQLAVYLLVHYYQQTKRTMMQRILSFSLTVLVVAAPHVTAFSTKSSPSMVQLSRCAYDFPRRTQVSLRQSTENVTAETEDTDDVTCYIVNDEEIITEGEKPHVVCTSEPDDVSLLHTLSSRMSCFYSFRHAQVTL